jgi:hypothetical protein
MDQDQNMKAVKKDNLKDKANEMKVVKKDAPAAANQSKKFTNKVEKAIQMTQTPKKVKGVEVMEVPGKEKVLALKEAILREFNNTVVEAPEHITKGHRVMTRDKKKVGEVVELDQDTASVKLDDDTIEHIQLNVLTARDVPAKQEKQEEATLDTGNYPSKQEWDSMSEEDRFEKMMNSAAAKFGEKQLKIRAKDDFDTLTKYNPRVKQAMAFPKSPLTASENEPEKEFPIKGDLGTAAEKFKKSLKEKLVKAVKEVLYKNKKSGQIQSFDTAHPEDKEIMKDPQFNQVFTKA